MPVNVKTTSMTFPYPLGKLSPGAAYQTKSVPLTENVMPVGPDGATPDLMVNGVHILAHPENDGNIYVCNSAAAPDKTDYSNVLAVLLPGQWYPRGKEWGNSRNLGTLFIGADNATDFAIATMDVM